MSDLDLAIRIALEMGSNQAELTKLKTLLTELSKVSPDPKVKAQIEAIVKNLDNMETALKDVEKESGKAGKELETLASRATIEKLKDMGSMFSVISGKIFELGKGLVDAAGQAQNFRTAMITAFQGNEEAADKLLEWAKDFANYTNFDTPEVVQSTIKLKAYGIAAEEIPGKLKAIGDMAAGMGKSLDQAVEAFADASTGELERLKEFGITKSMIDEQVNGAVSNAANKTEEIKAIMEGLSQIMETRFAGGMERASKTFEGSMSNFRGELQGLKEEFGEQILPELSKVVEKGSEIVKWLRDLSPEIKNNIVTWGEWALGITAAGTAIAGIATYIVPAIETIGGLSVAFLGLPATIALVVGAIAAIGIEWMKTAALIKQNELKIEMDKTADAVRVLRDAYNEAAGAAALYLKVKNELANSDPVTFASSEEGKEKIGAAKTLANDWLSDLKKELDAAEKKYFADEKRTTLGEMIFGEDLKEQEANLERLRNQIKELENDINNFEGTEKLSGLTAAGPVNPDYKPSTAGPRLKSITDAELSDEMQLQKNLLKANQQTWEQYNQNLQDFNNKYKLSANQKAKIDAEIVQTTEQEGKKLVQTQKQDWQSYLSELKVALSAGEISQKQYNDSISIYLSEHATELQNNTDLRLKIEKEYYSGVNKLQKENEKQQKEAEKERVKTIKEAWSTFIDELTVKLNEGEITQQQYMSSIKKYQQENIRDIQKVSGLSLDIEKKYSQEVKKLRQEEAAEAKKAAEAKLEAEQDLALELEALENDVVGSQIKSIEKKIQKYKDANVEQIKIEEYTQKAIQKLQEDTSEKFNQQIETQQQKISDLAEQIRRIDVKLAENREKQDSLLSLDSTDASPMKSIEEAFKTGLGEYTKKIDELKKLQEEARQLEADKAKAIREQIDAQEKLVKVQEDSKKATEELTAALNKNTEALGGSPPAKNPEDKPSEPKTPGTPDTPKNSDNNKPKQGDPDYIYGSDVGNYGGGNLPGKSTQGQGGNLPRNYTPSGFSKAGTGINYSGHTALGDGRTSIANDRPLGNIIIPMGDGRSTSSQLQMISPSSGGQQGGQGSGQSISYTINIDGKTINASSQMKNFAQGLTNDVLKYGGFA